MIVRSAPAPARAAPPAPLVPLALTLRGIVGVVLGLLAFWMPLVVLLSLPVLFAVYILVCAVTSMVMMTLGHLRNPALRWLLLAAGAIAALAAAISLAAVPEPGRRLFGVVAAWAAVAGLLECTAAVAGMPDPEPGRLLVGASGILSLAFGVLVALRFLPPALTVAWVLAPYALVSGALAIALAFRLLGSEPAGSRAIRP
jgi:uncharacterized membrane protein HdeD (DUF308 family)